MKKKLIVFGLKAKFVCPRPDLATSGRIWQQLSLGHFIFKKIGLDSGQWREAGGCPPQSGWLDLVAIVREALGLGG